ncbi:NAD(P)/FAD-dependent oxidoreductase [Nocardioides sp. NPDC126508]
MGPYDVTNPRGPAAGGATYTSVVIIGSGFSGLAMAAKLDRAGIRDFVILEHADGVGGTWRDNTYPGCACDIPSPLYSYSFDQNSEWSHLFAGQPEILRYLESFARRRNLEARTQFRQRVVAASWDDEAQLWTVRTAGGATFVAPFLVSAMGLLHKAKTPTIPGLTRFAGPAFHSAEWNHDVDLAGKRVAVIGTGASAIQFVPAIVDQVSSMAVFQRSAPWILPKANRTFDERDKRRLRRAPWLKWYRRYRLYWQHEGRATTFTNVATVNDTTVGYARAHLARQVPDPDLRAMLTPDYALGCKRLLISSDYYPAVAQSHVELVTDAISEVTETAVVTAEGRSIDVDCIIFGTGFDAQNALSGVSIAGRNGVTLAEAWANGMHAYLGTTVRGFPNFFILCGPNTGLGHNSQVFMIERQVKYAIAAIKAASGRDAAIEVGQRAQDGFRHWIDKAMAATVWKAGGCTSWYLDPKTGKNTLLWPSTTIDYWKRTRRLARSDYDYTANPAAALENLSSTTASDRDRAGRFLA